MSWEVGAFLLVAKDASPTLMTRRGPTFRTLERYRTTVVATSYADVRLLQRRPVAWTAVILDGMCEQTATRIVDLFPAGRTAFACLGMRSQPRLTPLRGQPALIDFVRTAIVHEVCDEPLIAQAVVAFARARSLTTREAELLAATICGVDRDQFVEELGLSRNTCKRHVRGLLSKLGETSLERAALRVLRQLVRKGVAASAAPVMAS